jgi:MFS family permease
VAYVIWPPVAGFLVGMVGEMKTFAIVGALVAVIAFILLFVTPKKLRLPEREIKTWH